MSNHNHKKILLVAINAKYMHSNPGAYSLCAYAIKHNPGAPIETKAFTINQNDEQITEEIYSNHPDLVGFSCYIWNITAVRRIVQTLHALLPETQIWLGGPEVSYCAGEMLDTLPVYGVMKGEGELTFSNLVCEFLLQEAGDYRRVKGIATRDFDTGACELIAMDELPFIYRDFPAKEFENRILYYESSRGCPYACSYCLSSVEKKLRFKSLPLVYEELQFFLDHKVRQVKFVDRTFNSSNSHAMAIWQFLKEHDNGVTNFHFEIAAETLSDEALDLIQTMRPGLLRLEIGVQSTNPDTLKAIHRIMDLEKCKRVATTLRRQGNVKLHLDLIAGLPGEGYDRFVQSFNDVYSLHPHELQLGFLKVLKGTPIAAEAESAGIVCTKEPPYEVLFTKDITYAELRRLKGAEEMLEIYYNSGQFVRSLAYLETFFDSAYALYEALADYYRKEGFALIQPSRMKRYEILLSFWEEKTGYNPKGSSDREQTMRKKMCECLLYDLYARENLKKRPAFAGEQDTKIHAYFKGDKQLMHFAHAEYFKELTGEGRVLLFDYRKRDPVTDNVHVEDITDQTERKKAE